jgi:hypothetical protein
MFLLRVCDPRARLPFTKGERRFRDLVASPSFDGVVETGMIGVELQELGGIVGRTRILDILKKSPAFAN